MASSSTDTEGYKRFRGWVAQQKISIDSDKTWKYYDYGPKEVTPIVFIPGASGTAEVFYKQFLSLCPRGHRVISVQPAAYMSHEDWCKGFDLFLDKINVDKIHLFGTSIGGFSAQVYVQYKMKSKVHRVLSLVLCNTFSDTSYYKENAPCVDIFPFMPEFMLKRIILSNLPVGEMEHDIAESIDFMVNQMETLRQKEIASRLTLNCSLYALKPSEWDNSKFDKRKITVIDTIDEVAVPPKLREELYKYYPEAKIAELKTGGNFPYISRSDEFNMLLQVHMNRVQNMEKDESEENVNNSSEGKKSPSNSPRGGNTSESTSSTSSLSKSSKEEEDK